MQNASAPPASLAFGRFLVLPHRREVLADGQPLKLGSRAYDVLMALIEAHGAVVSKDALIARVWPSRVVEENALQTQISALRAAFGAERELIRTVSGRGYQFTGEIRPLPASNEGAGPSAVRPPSVLPPTNLPEPISELVGRDAELREVLGLAAANRLVTLTGAGGMGKTRLAIAAARALLPQFADGTWFCDLAPLADPDLVSVTVAATLGLELAGGAISPERVANALSSRPLLLVLDNCEHVVGAAAAMAEAILRAGSSARIIATSREPLRAEGEQIYLVPPLAVPEGDEGELARYGAVQLFLDRARASGAQISADRQVAVAIAAICRRLDGMPLAIELAAARAAALGLDNLVAGLDNRFSLLTSGRRTVVTRHQTLRATLDWSYELLPDAERCLLRGLGVFAGGFALDAAVAVMRETDAAAAVVEGIANLVGKSLVTFDGSADAGRWRLLDTIRAYARMKLAEAGEADQAARRHAVFFRDLLAPAAEDPSLPLTADAVARSAREIDNVRVALDWAFSVRGDQAIGAVLTAAYAPVWLKQARIAECRERTERAAASLGGTAQLSAPLTMQLHLALGYTLIHTMGPVERTRTVLARALAIAEQLDDVDAQLQTLGTFWVFHFYCGECRATRSVAEQFCRIAPRTGDPAVIAVGERLRGNTLHYLGHQREAQSCFEALLDHHPAPEAQRRMRWFAVLLDHGPLIRQMLARVLWLRGSPERALHLAQSALEHAQAIGNSNLMCAVLCFAVYPVTLMTGDLAAAEHATALFSDLATRLNAAFWRVVGDCLTGKLLIKRGACETGAALLHAALETAERSGWTMFHPEFLGALAEGLAALGRPAEALATIERALAVADRDGERCYLPELLRINGELLLQDAGQGAVRAAEDRFKAALAEADAQGALFWELRGALSLARLQRDQGRGPEARDLLGVVYGRFTEGHGTADLRAAKQLLDELATAPARAPTAANAAPRAAKTRG